MATNPQLVVIGVAPVVSGSTASLTLVCATTGVVIGGKDLDFRGQGKPMSFLFELSPASGLRFPSDPADAASFAPGNGKPPRRGDAGGRFKPEAVSTAGDLLLVHAHGGPAATFSAELYFERIAGPASPPPPPAPPPPPPQTGGTQPTGTTTLAAAAISGGPIIIND